MRSFSLGSFDNNDGWFRVGTLQVTTTVLLTALGVMSFFIYAIEGAGGPVLRGLALIPSKVLRGQIWRLVTWPIPEPSPDIWAFLTLAFFFLFGTQLERIMGRQKYTVWLGALIVIPAVLTLLFELVVDPNFGSFGLAGIRFLELAVLAGFVTAFPTTKFFGVIPGWALVGVIIGLDLLRFIGNRLPGMVLFLVLMTVTAVIGIRSMGFSEHDETKWIPKVPLPPSLGGDPYRASNQQRTQTQKRKKSSRRRGSPDLQVVPTKSDTIDPVDELEMDALLDQVADNGLDSLSKDQRKRLEEYSKRLRKRNDG